MNKTVMLSAPLLLGLMAGCVAKQPLPPPEPVTIDPVHQERCYVMDRADQELAGYAMLDSGHQFYFQPDCESNRYVDVGGTFDNHPVTDDLPATEDQGVASDEDKEGPDWLTVSEDEKAPPCIYDKMTAGEPGLEPCPWDEEKKKYVK